MQTKECDALGPWPIEDQSVNAVITSPPYWQIRKYEIPDVVIGGSTACRHNFDNKIHTDKRGTKGFKLQGSDHVKPNRLNYVEGTCIKCGAWRGQYGLEPDFKLFLKHTLLWIKEVKRVLKKDGLFILNMGDKYLNGSKLKLPDRVVIALMDDEGWLNRNDIVWHKPNGIPGSMKSRFISRHEEINILALRKDHYFDLDAVRAPYNPDSIRRNGDSYKKSGVPCHASPDGKAIIIKRYEMNPLGANPGDVWTYSANKAQNGHYATYPELLIERLVKCSTKPGDIVLDPFVGSGTTLKVAEQLGRRSIGFDIGYADIRAERLTNIQKELI